MSKPRIIAFYLPQFYPTPENDKWWGKGFTEWTNVGRAKPLFHGHYQPKVPADLGYYDLRVPEVRVQQADLAKAAEIEGFMYWHYWFDGTKLLNMVFEEVVKSGSPNYPFSLCWANHSWYKKTWDPNNKDTLLIEQTYSGRQDYINHFNYLLPAFKDKRYIKVDNKLLFGIYSPDTIPDIQLFFEIWNELAMYNGLNGFYFVAYEDRPSHQDKKLRKLGYDSYIQDFYSDIGAENKYKHLFERACHKVLLKSNVTQTKSYDFYCKSFLKQFCIKNNVHPCILPNYDHSPRSHKKGLILTNSTPIKWGRLCSHVFEKCKNRKHEENFIFIKAWNEWGEGNYLEPDLKYGHGYLDNLKDAFDKCK